jgi:hypothetical protein
LKKVLITTAKVSISVMILVYLFWNTTHGKDGGKAFSAMLQQPKHWDFLVGGALLTVVGTLLTLIRWCYLVRALGIPLPMRDALRIGSIGCMVNLLPMGIVGGDVVKAVMLAHEHPGNRAKSAASVIVDRIIGLWVLFVVALVGVWLSGYWRVPIPEIHHIFQVLLVVTVVSTVGIVILLLPGVLDGSWVGYLTRIPRIGRTIGSLVDAGHMYRRNLPVLFLSSVVTIGVHCTFTLAVYFVACGLPGNHLPLKTQFAVYPVSAVANTLPLPAGPFEAVLEFFYTHVHEAGCEIAKGQGLIVALIYRLFGALIGVIGLIYYLRGRSEVAEVMHEVEEEGQDGDEAAEVAKV